MTGLATSGLCTRVFFLIGSLEVGGSERQLVELASRLDPLAFDVTVCSMTAGGPLADELRRRRVRTIELGFTGVRGDSAIPGVRGLATASRGILRLWWTLVRERPDVVHGFLITAYLTATFVGRLAGVRRIVASRRSLGRFKEDRRFALALERVADRFTDLFIANSEAVRADTIAREPVQPSRIIVIPNGLEFDRFHTASRRGAASAPRVIVVANLIHYKGHEIFLQAWKTVVGRFPAARALLVGEGAYRAVLERQVDRLQIRNSVQFLGTRADVPELLAASDIYVHPSFEEGSSNALLEAMASGLPVIATAVGGNVEAVTDGDTGLLVPPADAGALAAAMCRLLSDPPAATAMGTRARAAVRSRHDMNGMVRAYEAAYRALVAGTAPRADVARAQVKS